MAGLRQFSLVLCASAIVTVLPAQTLPLVYFNHITIYVPQPVYDALAESSFLRNEFSGFQEQTVERDGGTWNYTGLFLYGQHTYFEIFKAGPQARPSGTITMPAGLVVFNMWLDDRKELPMFRDRVAEARGSAMQIVTTRDAKNQPAYDSVLQQGGLALSPGVLGYTALKGYYPDGVTRERRFPDRYHPEREMHDITGVTLTVSEAERNALVRDFVAYAYQVKTDGDKRIVSGPGMIFTLVPMNPGKPRRLMVDISLNRTVADGKTYRFDDGNELRVEGSTAEWIFGFPQR